jgi:hypothetical protein
MKWQITVLQVKTSCSNIILVSLHHSLRPIHFPITDSKSQGRTTIIETFYFFILAFFHQKRLLLQLSQLMFYLINLRWPSWKLSKMLFAVYISFNKLKSLSHVWAQWVSDKCQEYEISCAISCLWLPQLFHIGLSTAIGWSHADHQPVTIMSKPISQASWLTSQRLNEACQRVYGLVQCFDIDDGLTGGRAWFPYWTSPAVMWWCGHICNRRRCMGWIRIRACLNIYGWCTRWLQARRESLSIVLCTVVIYNTDPQKNRLKLTGKKCGLGTVPILLLESFFLPRKSDKHAGNNHHHDVIRVQCCSRKAGNTFINKRQCASQNLMASELP